QQARQRLVAAREEERRRLRRDLHDGLGPQLASLSFKAEAARNLFRRDGARADALLAAVADQAQEAIADIRRLVHALRPPALDELGLVAALRQHAAGPLGLGVTVEAPAALPPLPAAVEVAAYRIAQEAVTNAARHARARSCVVRLTPETAALRVEVADDGVGLPPERAAGVGLHSMRERAAELGGSCVVEGRPGGGTRVVAMLPIAVWPGDAPPSDYPRAAEASPPPLMRDGRTTATRTE
ncbi:MAG: sensor histidine kinase, partial [Chloroflexota bacterium]|nr:sensor histidine kinase [Chloroflexota bacterium]